MSVNAVAAFIGPDRVVKLVLPKSPSPDTAIWHYTKKSVADIITETGIFRATHCADFADESEVVFGIQELRSALVRSSSTDRRSSAAKEWVLDLIEHQVHHLFQLPHYALCASVTRFSSYLWEHYAGHDGRAIGIPCEEAVRLAVIDAESQCQNTAYNFVSWQHVIYGKRTVRQFADRTIACLFEVFSDEQAAANVLLYFIPFVKKAAFRSEQEVRLLVSQAGPSEHTAEKTDGLRRFVDVSYANLMVPLSPTHAARPGGPEYRGKISTTAQPLPRASIKLYSVS